MIRILTVDDELLILNTICNYVEQHFDAEVFRAASGFEALDLLRRMRFDVVITDVSMPMMDGIELMRNVKRVWPQCYVIILTVYDRFDYAYEATKYNQVEYVLKSDSMQALHSSLQRAVEWIESEMRKEQMFSRLGQQIENMKPQIQAETVRQLLRKPSEMPAKEELAAIGLDLDPEKPVLPILGVLDSAHQNRTAVFLPDIAEALYRNLSGRGIKLQLVQISGEILGLTQTDGSSPDSEAMVFVTDALERCIESLERGSNTRLAAVVCESFIPWRLLPQNYDQMTYQLEDLRNTAALKVCVGHELAMRRRYDCISPESIDLLWQYIRTEDADRFRKTLTDLLAPLEEVSNMDALYPLAEAYALGFLYLKASRLMDPDEAREPSFVFMQMQTFSSIGISGPEWIRAVLRQFDGLFIRREAIGADNANQLVDRVRDYIRRHYSEDIHLSTIAETFHYSPSYLSRLYKEHTGENLSNDISNIRIGAAQKLLLSTTLSVNEVGQRCGFYSNKYFLQIFKKATGMTPSQYRQKS